MFPAPSLLFLPLAAIAFTGVSGASIGHKVEGLAFTRVRLNSTISMRGIIAADRSRISHYKEDSAARMAAKEAPDTRRRAAYSFEVTNAAVSVPWSFRALHGGG